MVNEYNRKENFRHKFQLPIHVLMRVKVVKKSTRLLIIF